MTQPDLFDVGKRKPWHKLKGYPAKPGTGPEGMACKDCVYCHKIILSKTFYKCVNCRVAWTNSVNTDIKLKSPACSEFQDKLNLFDRAKEDMVNIAMKGKA